MAEKRKCVFFDRDGIVNFPPARGGYVTTVEDFEVIPAFLEALQTVLEAGYDAIVITNQQGVGKGLYSETTLNEIHEKLIRVVEECGLKLLDIYYCPHLVDQECDCRKPKPGMLLKAAEKWNIDLSMSWMVGDQFRDIDTGSSAGCKTILVNKDLYSKAIVQVDNINRLSATLSTILTNANQ